MVTGSARVTQLLLNYRWTIKKYEDAVLEKNIVKMEINDDKCPSEYIQHIIVVWLCLRCTTAVTVKSFTMSVITQA